MPGCSTVVWEDMKVGCITRRPLSLVSRSYLNHFEGNGEMNDSKRKAEERLHPSSLCITWQCGVPAVPSDLQTSLITDDTNQLSEERLQTHLPKPARARFTLKSLFWENAARKLWKKLCERVSVCLCECLDSAMRKCQYHGQLP